MIAEDLESFHRSWMSRDSECRMEEDKLTEKKNYRIEENEMESEEKEDQIFDLFYGKSQKWKGKNIQKKTAARKNLRNEEETYSELLLHQAIFELALCWSESSFLPG